jgi:hypothetical protein
MIGSNAESNKRQEQQITASACDAKDGLKQCSCVGLPFVLQRGTYPVRIDSAGAAVVSAGGVPAVTRAAKRAGRVLLLSSLGRLWTLMISSCSSNGKCTNENCCLKRAKARQAGWVGELGRWDEEVCRGGETPSRGLSRGRT